ncbi:unnamed protein product [Caretta caretta]
MGIMMRLVNYIRSMSSLQHRLFKAEHSDVRWLSRGRMLERFSALQKEIIEFLSYHNTNKACEFLAFMNVVPSMSQVAFLCDITGHLNSLNLQLQGHASNVGNLFEKLCAFQRSLKIFQT